MDVHRYERDGDVWEVRNTQSGTRYDGEPCIYVEMRGDPETFFMPGKEILQVCDLEEGWRGYWYLSDNLDIRENIRRLVELLERQAARQR